MERKTCWNCLHEYQCDWKPAGEHDCCKDWTKEYNGEEKKNGENQRNAVPVLYLCRAVQ